MKPSTIEGNLRSIKKHLKDQLPDLTVQDLDVVEKPQAEMIKYLQYRTGLSRDQVIMILRKSGYWC